MAEITRVDLAGVVGQELGGEGWKTIYSAPDSSESGPVMRIEVADESLREAIKEELLAMAEELTIGAGYASTFKGQVYSALLHHVRAKFLNGSSLGLAERAEVELAWKMLPAVEGPGLGRPRVGGRSHRTWRLAYAARTTARRRVLGTSSTTTAIWSGG